MPKRPKRVRKQRKTIDKDEKPSNWKEKAVKLMKSAWFYDCSVQWYHFNGNFLEIFIKIVTHGPLKLFQGKGAAWLVILTPFILLFGPFLMSCYIFNLNKRGEMCWHKCWKTDPKYDWFNCKVYWFNESHYLNRYLRERERAGHFCC